MSRFEQIMSALPDDEAKHLRAEMSEHLGVVADRLEEVKTFLDSTGLERSITHRPVHLEWQRARIQLNYVVEEFEKFRSEVQEV